MTPMTATEKKKLRDAASMPRSRALVERLAKDVNIRLDEQRAHLAKARSWVTDAESDLAVLEEQSAFFKEILSEIRI